MNIIKNITTILVASTILIPATTVAGEKDLDEVKEIADEFYVDPITDEMKEATTIEAFMDQLDPYSTYFTDEEYNQFLEQIEGDFVGIGIGYQSNEDKEFIVQQVFPGSPAEEAGIQPGDIITQVNDESVEGYSTEKVVTLISGEEGTDLNLTLKRLFPPETYSVSVTREKIEVPTVSFEELGADIGVIHISSFNNDTVAETKAVLQDHPSIQGWIVDLRNNPGGYLTASRQLLGMFPTVETAINVKSRGQKTEIAAIPQNEQFAEPTYVLINKNSASASEITAGALKDYEAATLYGETTFGKGLMQEMFGLSNNHMLKLSTFHFTTPTDAIIQGEGINPDIESELPLEDAHEDLLDQLYSDYQHPVASMTVAPDKSFTIEFNSDIKIDSLKTHLDVVQYGKFDVAYELRKQGSRKVVIDPIEDLEEGDYSIVLQPGYTNSASVRAKKGMSMDFTVQDS